MTAKTRAKIAPILATLCLPWPGLVRAAGPNAGNEWDRNVQLKYQGTAASLVTQPTTTTLESCSYVERVLGVGAPN
jgi:hypothetical protein